MTILQAVILGVVQGIGEFLPISSSAHLIFIPWLFKWDIPNSMTFDISLHVGTLIAVLSFFWKDWIYLIKDGFTKGIKTFSGKMFWFLVIATIPGVLAGKFLDDYAEGFFRTSNFMPILIALALSLMGIILYMADKYGKCNTDYEHLTFKQTLIIGLAQAFAVIPGTSRSGVTMSAGRAIGVDRESAAKFSFLLSAPIIGGAAVYQFVFKFNELVISEINLVFFAGILTSMVVGFLSIKFLLKYLKTSNFNIFVIYRVIVAIILIMTYCMRSI